MRRITFCKVIREMNAHTVPTLVALGVQIALGLAVFQANRRRLANQCFLLLSLTIGAWLGSLYLAFIARSPSLAEFAIRQASAAGDLLLRDAQSSASLRSTTAAGLA